MYKSASPLNGLHCVFKNKWWDSGRKIQTGLLCTFSTAPSSAAVKSLSTDISSAFYALTGPWASPLPVLAPQTIFIHSIYTI